MTMQTLSQNLGGEEVTGRKLGLGKVEEAVSGKRMFLALPHDLRMRDGDPGIWKVSLGQVPWCLGSLPGSQERQPLPSHLPSVFSHTYVVQWFSPILDEKTEAQRHQVTSQGQTTSWWQRQDQSSSPGLLPGHCGPDLCL